MTRASSGVWFGDSNQPGMIGGVIDSCIGAMRLPMAKNVWSHSLTAVVPVLEPAVLRETSREVCT